MTQLDTTHWLSDPDLSRLLDTLQAIGEARFIGGVVRDTLLGIAHNDIDLATTAKPQDVLKACREAGFRMVETGMAHGTVSAILPRGPIEITTLRRDVATDGRHAEVAFTSDWQADAARRDFTINALSCGRDGTVHDYFEGVADLRARRVRFIGEPSARIREDYLRILRFFRFSARYAVDLNPAALRAVRDNRQGMGQLSGERILSETLKLLETPRAAALWRAMAEAGIAAKIVGVDDGCDRLERLVDIERETASPDAFRRLMVLMPPDAIDKIAKRLKFSGLQRKRAKAIPLDADRRADLQAGRFARALYGSDARSCVDQAFIDTIDGAMTPEVLRDLLSFTATWSAPVFPLGGENLMELGLKPGPIFGTLLKEVEQWWIGQDFQPTRQQCFAELKRIWFARKGRN
jgi:poly(A) polymerase